MRTNQFARSSPHNRTPPGPAAKPLLSLYWCGLQTSYLMFHTEINRSLYGSAACNGERRRTGREPGPVREVVLAWDHNLTQRLRFRLIDLSDDGLRIASMLPILKDLSGIAITVLSEQAPVNRPFVVAWSSESPVEGEYHAGLRFTA